MFKTHFLFFSVWNLMRWNVRRNNVWNNLLLFYFTLGSWFACAFNFSSWSFIYLKRRDLCLIFLLDLEVFDVVLWVGQLPWLSQAIFFIRTTSDGGYHNQAIENLRTFFAKDLTVHITCTFGNASCIVRHYNSLANLHHDLVLDKHGLHIHTCKE